MESVVVSLVTTYLFISLIVYFIPFVISLFTGNRKRQVFLINLFLGWTVLGWVWAFVWAILPEDTGVPSSTRANNNPTFIKTRASVLEQLSALQHLYERGAIERAVYEKQKQVLNQQLQEF
jgi:hypothetical protein